MPVAFSLESRAGPSAIREITDALGSRTEIETVLIPADCADGLNEAYYARPEMLLDRPHARPAGIARTPPALPDSPHLAA